MKRVLILGGTGEARKLAAFLLTQPELTVISSLAGRTQDPLLPPGPVHTGGFGGIPGLVSFLETAEIHAVLDATHPFAQKISHHSFIATQKLGIPHIYVVRRAWSKTKADRWYEVPDHQTAAGLIPQLGQHIFLTIGRQELCHYAQVPGWFLMRMIEPPDPNQARPKGEILLQRGPFGLEEEITLMQTHRIDLLVSKNSGGPATFSKILAARRLNCPVIMIQRPSLPNSVQVNTISQAWAWLRQELFGGDILPGED